MTTEFPIPEAFAEFDFPVVSVWGLTDKHECRCVRGKDCPTPGKHPIPHDGFKSATTDIERLRLMLSAPGSQGQWGLRPAPNTILIDADGEGFAERVKELGLTETLIVRSGAGLHLYFHWPPEYGPVPTHLFGWKVRSNDHQGIVVGPGSQHVSGRTYRFHRQNGHNAYEMLATIATFPRSLVPPEKQKTPGNVASITVGGHVEPESIQEGGRYDYLRDRARPLWGIGLSGEDLFNAVDAFNKRFPVPHDRATVERAIDEERLNRNFQRDAIVAPVVIPSTGLFVDIADYRAANPSVAEWVSPLAAYGTVTLVSGSPKAGKSTLISNLFAARENGTTFLWGDPVPTGPMVLVTEEGGFPVVRKAVGLSTLVVLDRMAFVVAGLRSLDHLLEALTGWTEGKERALVVIDTFAVWGDIKDENDATVATRAIVALRVWAQSTGAAVLLVHHTRKGGGDHGDAVRGSSGILAAVDTSVEMSFTNDAQSDDRNLVLSGRLSFGEAKVLAFDRPSMTYSITTRVVEEKHPIDQFPLDGTGEAGFSAKDAAGIWGCTEGTASNRLRDLVTRGRLAVGDERSEGSKASHKVYWRARPLLVLDGRSVSEQMADIFEAE
jgi:hypothetical protein